MHLPLNTTSIAMNPFLPGPVVAMGASAGGTIAMPESPDAHAVSPKSAQDALRKADAIAGLCSAARKLARHAPSAEGAD